MVIRWPRSVIARWRSVTTTTQETSPFSVPPGLASTTKLDELQPKLLALIPSQIHNQQTNRDLTMTNYVTTSGIYDRLRRHCRPRRRVEDDYFHLPPEAFSNPEFLRMARLMWW